VPDDVLPVASEPVAGLRSFHRQLRDCLIRRGDALFELADAMLCTRGRVCSPVELSLEPEFRRGRGSVYAALGRVDASTRRRCGGCWCAAAPRLGWASR
jgi:hypothetical protein